MAPTNQIRQLLVWSAPTLAIFLTYLWYRKTKRTPPIIDRVDLNPRTSTRISEPETIPFKQKSPTLSPIISSSEPIDIRPNKNPPIIMSDTELDMEIEKFRSMKNGVSFSSRPKLSPEKEITPIVVRAQSTDRDSANHSPIDVLIASPSLSSISDNQSEEGNSSDSGKGGSDVATPPLPLNTTDEVIEVIDQMPSMIPMSLIHEFIIPQQLVGRLIGKHGAFVQQIKATTNALVLIKKHPDTVKSKVCTVQGSQTEIDAALAMIREKFPAKRYPNLTMEHVVLAMPIPIVPECMHLKLIEGTNNDTIVSCIVAPNHLFLQQPTHPTFPNLNVLSNYMTACYSDASSPLLPAPIKENTICAAFSSGVWYRTIIVSTDSAEDTSCVKFLDFGGYTTICNSMLRQIRGDFLLLPFQASECVLADIDAPDGVEWPEEAFNTVTELTSGTVMCTQVLDYLEDGVPLVNIYIRAPDRVFLLNEELVRRGQACWLQPVQ